MEQRILGQITKLLGGGLLLYGWKKTGTVDPDDGDAVLWLPYGTVAPEGYEPWMMNMSVVGQTKSGDRWGRWGECYTCLEEFPLTEMTKIKGHWYCSKNGCKEDFE